MNENPLKTKSFDFALRIVKLYKYLSEQHSEYILSKQLLRSGTAIGALYREAEYAETKKDFIHKLAIAQKEANESIYWLELLQAAEYLTQQQFESLQQNAIELLKLITSIITSSKKSLSPTHPQH